MKQRLLIIDDEVDNVDALERLFRKDYEVLRATSGAQGLQELSQYPDVALIICDQRMPQMTGVEFFQKAVKSHPHTIRILLTGYTDINSVIDAINSGQVYRYMTKPWDPVDLANTVNKGVEHYRLGQELIAKNQQLQKAFAELQVLDQSKTQFMMLVNHELKTPLTTILSFVDLLRETKMSDDQFQYLSRVYSGAMRLKELVDDVLLLLSAEMQTLPVNTRSASVNELLPKMTPQIFTEVQNKKLKVDHKLPEGKVSTDPQLVQNVMNRILQNAVKFSPPGEPIWIEGSFTGDKLKIRVKNSGAMDPKTLEKLTTPFFINENMLNHSRGMGLGLSISQALLRRLGSKLEVRSENGTVEVGFQL
jgi:two-component system sensor histidine kinase/response regulator